jgi:SPOR domain
LRVLFLLLLLANVLFLAWTRWVVPPQPVTAGAAASASALQPIRLQQELTAATTAAGAAAGEDLLAAACVSVGPFGDPAQAEAARLQLERLGFSSRRRVAQDEVQVGYWVRVPDLATPADAANALGALQAAGLADAYIVDGDGAVTTVSIGVYADAGKAAEVAQAVQAAGFTPETSDRLRTLEVLWLDVDRLANGGLPAPEDLGESAAGALPYDFRACPAAGTAGDVTPPANR